MAHAMRARQPQQQQQQQQQQHARVRALSLSLSPAVRCAEAPHAGMAPVDLNDVQTMADSWLRLLEVRSPSTSPSPPPPPSLSLSLSSLSSLADTWLPRGVRTLDIYGYAVVRALQHARYSIVV
jgi:hypothetical protein